MASFATGTDQKGIVLQNLIEGGAPAIWADQGVVAQTLDAIVGNIIRFSDDQGLVTLEYLQEPDGDTEHVTMNVSAPLSGAGKITRGDPPDSVAPITIKYTNGIIDVAAVKR